MKQAVTKAQKKTIVMVVRRLLYVFCLCFRLGLAVLEDVVIQLLARLGDMPVRALLM